MAKAGYCSRCGGNTWLNESGGCVAGHGPECVSNVYEVAHGPAPTPLPTPPASSGGGKAVWLIALAVLLPMALLMCGIVAAIAIPVFSGAKVNAQRRACYANMRVVQGAAMAYAAEKEAAVKANDWPELVGQLTPTYFSKPPVCPAGGTYVWTPSTGSPIGGTLRCTVHGPAPELPRDATP